MRNHHNLGLIGYWLLFDSFIPLISNFPPWRCLIFQLRDRRPFWFGLVSPYLSTARRFSSCANARFGAITKQGRPCPESLRTRRIATVYISIQGTYTTIFLNAVILKFIISPTGLPITCLGYLSWPPTTKNITEAERCRR